jgi:hypothetical protein
MEELLPDLLDLNLDRKDSLYVKEGPKEAGTASVRNILHNKGTAAVIKASAEKNKKEIQRYTTGSAYIDFDGVRVNIDDYFLPKLNLKLTPLTSKLLQLMLVDATPLLNQAVTEIGLRLNLAEVASDLDRNIEDKKAKYRFKKEFFNALEVLSRINLRVEEELNGKSINIGKAHLLSSFMPSKTEKDTTEVILGLEFLKYLSNGYLKSFDMNILKISDASSHQFHTAYNNYVTMGNNLIAIKNQKGPVKAKIFKVETAITWTATLPAIEDVKGGDRRYTQRILEPLEKILDDEHGLIEKWEWCKAVGEKLTDEERANIGSYDILKNLYVKVITLKKEEELLEGAYAAAGRIMEDKEKRAKQRARRVAKAKAEQPKPDKDE